MGGKIPFDEEMVKAVVRGGEPPVTRVGGGGHGYVEGFGPGGMRPARPIQEDAPKAVLLRPYAGSGIRSKLSWSRVRRLRRRQRRRRVFPPPLMGLTPPVTLPQEAPVVRVLDEPYMLSGLVLLEDERASAYELCESFDRRVGGFVPRLEGLPVLNVFPNMFG